MQRRPSEWDDVARVRTAPRRRLAPDASRGDLYFSPALVPAAAHPLVQALGEQAVRDVLTQRLYAYLDFTTHLEHRVVNEVSAALAHADEGLSLSREMRVDAYRLYCDEAYHALASIDICRQVEAATGHAPAVNGPPVFLGELDALFEPLSEEDRQLARLLFTIVSETMISGTLRRLPQDRSVADGVRDVVDDHAHDETRHHAYFASVLGAAWPQLRWEDKLRLGPLLPQFVLVFARPDLPRWRRSLEAVGLDAADVETVLADSFPDDAVRDGARRAARSTIGLFSRTGCFEVPEIAAAFRDAGLLEQEAARV